MKRKLLIDKLSDEWLPVNVIVARCQHLVNPREAMAESAFNGRTKPTDVESMIRAGSRRAILRSLGRMVQSGIVERQVDDFGRATAFRRKDK